MYIYGDWINQRLNVIYRCMYFEGVTNKKIKIFVKRIISTMMKGAKVHFHRLRRSFFQKRYTVPSFRAEWILKSSEIFWQTSWLSSLKFKQSIFCHRWKFELIETLLATNQFSGSSENMKLPEIEQQVKQPITGFIYNIVEYHRHIIFIIIQEQWKLGSFQFYHISLRI